MNLSECLQTWALLDLEANFLAVRLLFNSVRRQSQWFLVLLILLHCKITCLPVYFLKWKYTHLLYICLIAIFLKLTILIACEDTEQQEHWIIAESNATRYSHFRRQFGSSLPYNPISKHQDIYSTDLKMYAHTKIYSWTHIAPLLTVTQKNWKQPRCP